MGRGRQGFSSRLVNTKPPNESLTRCSQMMRHTTTIICDSTTSPICVPLCFNILLVNRGSFSLHGIQLRYIDRNERTLSVTSKPTHCTLPPPSPTLPPPRDRTPRPSLPLILPSHTITYELCQCKAPNTLCTSTRLTMPLQGTLKVTLLAFRLTSARSTTSIYHRSFTRYFLGMRKYRPQAH